MNKKCAIVLALGAIVASCSIALLVLWGSIYRNIKQNNLELSSDSTNFKMWEKTPIPLYLEFYLFNLTNPTEVLNAWNKGNYDVKPKLVETGPYVYREVDERRVLNFNDNNTVTYVQKRTWNFDAELSKGNLTDSITNFNVIAATVGDVLKKKNILIREAANFLLRSVIKEKLVVTKTVEQWLFTGITDSLLTLLKTLNLTEVPNDKFAWFYSRNNSFTYDGVLSIFSGYDDLNKVGMLDMWNGRNNTHLYDGDCGAVNGTTGQLLPPMVDKEELRVFVTDICSSFVTRKTPDKPSLHGLNGIRLVAENTTFDNGTADASKACYISSGGSLQSGIRNVSGCFFNAPAFISFPHFYQADEWYRRSVDGMRPNPQEHETFIEMEPKTGVPLNIRAQFQINIMIQPVKNVKLYSSLPTKFIPMLWFRQRATLTPSLASRIKTLVLLLPGGYYASGIGLVLGLLVLLVAGLRMYSEQVTRRPGYQSVEGDDSK